MRRLSARERAELIVRVLAQRPWVQPLVGIAHPNDVLGFIRDELRDVRITDGGWNAAGQMSGISISVTPGSGVLTRPALVRWGDVARHLRPDLTAAQLGLGEPPDEIQAELF
jgi:hypothetical protein